MLEQSGYNDIEANQPNNASRLRLVIIPKRGSIYCGQVIDEYPLVTFTLQTRKTLMQNFGRKHIGKQVLQGESRNVDVRMLLFGRIRILSDQINRNISETFAQ